jgi:hypothetical protein
MQEFQREGNLIYRLRQDGWIMGRPKMRNEVEVRVTIDPSPDGESPDMDDLVTELLHFLNQEF